MDMNKLKELREARALSLRELSERSGVGRNTILRIEHGHTNVWPRTVRHLAEALGVEPRELIGPRDG